MKLTPYLLPALLAGGALVLPDAARAAGKNEYIAYVGTYTGRNGNGSKGIYAYRFHANTGKLESIGLVAETPNPTFLAISPNHRYLYAVNEVANYEGHNGSVSAYAIDGKTGKLTPLNRVSSRGAGPAHINVDHTGKYVLVANYGGGSVAVIAVQPDGSLGSSTAFIQHHGSSVNPRRQREPHAHSIDLSPDNHYAIVDDLGLDKVFAYRFNDTDGSLAENTFAQVKPGSGPRHFAFAPNGKFGYTISEMGSTMTAFSWDPSRGALTEIQTVSTLPAGSTKQSTCAEVEAHPSGRFLYGSNRGDDSIAVFRVDPSKGTLTPVEHVSTQGRTPRNFAIDPTGRFLIAENQDTNSMVIFRVNQKNGRLTPTGDTLELGAPVCIRFIPAE